MRAPSPPKWSRAALLRLATLLLLLTVDAILAPVLFANADLPFDSDESRHALNGLEAASDLLAGRWRALLENLYLQEWYPPLLSVYLAPFFVVLGPAYWSARYPMLMALILNLALLYRVGKALSGRDEIGLVGMVLLSTSPVLWMYGLLCMEEMIAMGAALIVALAWHRSTARVSGKTARWREWALGASLALAFVTRISSGLFMLGAVITAALLGPEPWRVRARRAIRATAPVAIVAALWWAHQAKLEGLIAYLRASSPAFRGVTWQALLFYWRAVASSYAVGPLVGALILASVIAAVRRWRGPRTRLLLSIVLATWLGLMLNRQLNARFFLNAMPMACLLAADWMWRISNQLQRWLRGRRLQWMRVAIPAALGAYGLLMLGVRVATLPFLMAVAYETEPATAQVHNWIADRAGSRPIFVINGWDQLSADAVDFHLATRTWPRWQAGTVAGVALADPTLSPGAVESFRDAMFAAADAQIVHLGNAPVESAGAWWAYKAALRSCWDGEWQESATLWVHLWDRRLENLVLSRPLRYVRASARSSARAELWYNLRLDVGLATCCSE